MTHSEDRDAVISWAKDILDAGCMILDTETTGLEGAEIVQIAIVRSTDGSVALDSLVRPEHPKKLLIKGRGGICASDIHGIKPEMLVDAPTLTDLWPQLRETLHDEILVVYNLDYDWPIVRAYGFLHDLPPIKPYSTHCAMIQYAAFYGDWNDYRQNYKWQPLLGGDHSAKGDCVATLELMQRMAAAAAPDPVLLNGRLTKPTTVVNVRYAERGTYVYIGRLNNRWNFSQSPFANPHGIGADGDRALAIKLYIAHLKKLYLSDVGKYDSMLDELQGEQLGCWCKEVDREVACHGDVLAMVVDMSHAERFKWAME